jgi:hypothetical protein
MTWVPELHPSNLEYVNRLPKHRAPILFYTFTNTVSWDSCASAISCPSWQINRSNVRFVAV